MSLPEYLKEARVNARLTQKEVADRLGYSSSQYVSNWERGLSAPPINALRPLAGLYGVESEELLEKCMEHKIDKTKEKFRRQV